MKKAIIILAASLMVGCLQIPNSGTNNNQRIKAKVIRITCATTVIQILDNAYFDLGETWTMQGTSNTFEHVAVILNKCELPQSLKEGDVFFFKVINESAARHDCVVCMMYDYPPSKGIFLSVVN